MSQDVMIRRLRHDDADAVRALDRQILGPDRSRTWDQYVERFLAVHELDSLILPPWGPYAMHGADRSFYIERACSRTDTRPSELILRHCMTAVENVEPLDQLVEVYGADNFVIGTDFSHPEFQRLPNATTDITGSSSLSDEDKSKILGGNLARALRL